MIPIDRRNPRPFPRILWITLSDLWERFIRWRA